MKTSHGARVEINRMYFGSQSMAKGWHGTTALKVSSGNCFVDKSRNIEDLVILERVN